MANIKLKDLLNEISVGGMVSRSPWIKEHDDTPQINIKELVSSINNYGSLGEQIYGKGSLKEVAQTLSKMAEGAAQHTLSETEDMFDKVTVSRNMKELTGLSKQFGKVAMEANSLQERMSGLYEDMGHILGRYYTIGEANDVENGEDSEEVSEMMFREDDNYKAFFQKAMKKFGVSSPDQLKPEDEKDFYNYVDRNYKAKNEAKAKGERGLADPLPDRDKDGNLTNPLEIQKRKLMKQKKEKTAQIDKASGFAAKQPLIKQKQRIQQKINDINRKLDR